MMKADEGLQMNRIFLIVVLLICMAIHMACPYSYAEDAVSGTAPKTEDASAIDADGPGLKLMSTASLASMGGEGDISSGSVGKGLGLSPLLSESFQTDLATGSATAGIPITVPPGRKNMQPSLALSYSNNNPNGVCGVGWSLSSSSIQRSTKKGTPKYDNSDTFVFGSSGSSGELVLVDPAAGEYRQKIETAFMKYLFDSADSKWTVWDKTGNKYTFGSSAASRIVSPDGTKIFAWYLDRVEDVYGNAVVFTYEKDAGQIYLSKVEYAVNSVVTPPLTGDKEVDIIYETGRQDVVSNYRSGWQVDTAKRLKEIRVKVDGVLVWRYELGYSASVDTQRSLLAQVTLFDAAGNSLPPKKFRYQTIE